MDAGKRSFAEAFITQWLIGKSDDNCDENADTVTVELVQFHRFAARLSTKSMRIQTLHGNGKLTMSGSGDL